MIVINNVSRVPKYKQIIDCVIDNIAKGKLKLGDKIPSINELSAECYLSRDTVEKAYRELKKRKVITSVKGKGFYITKTELISKINVFFLINKPSSYKLIIYNSFVNFMGADGHVTLSIYHCEESLFAKAIEKNMGAFDYYVIMPHFKNENLQHVSCPESIMEIIDEIPKEKLLLLDNSKPELSGNYGSVYQDFKFDIYDALSKALNKLKKYDRIILVYPRKSIFPYPLRILHGFHLFCSENQFDFEVLDEIYEDMELTGKDVYIIIEETDLVNLMQQIKMKGIVVGEEIGIISYNDTPLKALLDITVISTDFKAMGEMAASMILENTLSKIKNPFNYVERGSL
ncbi:GntR family transcriptional regulator [Muricauda sp. CAU 1633]|uniref:GntR family transcriptional regulator n=1 Tax=Allomuricauda sp. CAU 1633 TaxID=2816036 RepID=UPI001A8C878D|nr:GntR family transcriptional regulator [Muricauda sp. CAU 1633]MBO0324108.1 GntR family transcriptional regulator [Muricauda sp. CAU 1633]